jgi:hypothetical protein
MTKVTRIITELRILIGYLGEQRCPWWTSQFFSPTAHTFLAPIFARTFFQAQCQGVTAAAARLHDEHIGIGRTFHLFRMPEGIEQAVAATLATSVFESEMRPYLANVEVALDRLNELTSQQSAPEGPVAVGAMMEDLNQQLRRIAGLYYDAFSKGTKSFPYFREA